jgi:hypothetical protein
MERCDLAKENGTCLCPRLEGCFTDRINIRFNMWS